MMLGLLGCMTLDGFFFAPTPTDAYAITSEVIPAESIELDSFAGPDGSTLYGWWAHQDSAGAPVMIYFHGNSGNLDDTPPMVEALWSLGLEVYAVDYEGYGMSTGSPSHDHVIADAVATAGHVSSTTGVAVGDLLYYGQSLGGFATLHAALEVAPRALITDSTFANGALIGAESASIDMPIGWVLKEAYDNAAAIARLHLPVLVMHGQVDDYINIHHGDAVYAAANPPKFYWTVPGADHAELHEVDRAGWDAHVGCWVAVAAGDRSCVDGQLEGTSDLGE